MLVCLFILIINTRLTAQNPEQSIININNITSWIRNDGSHPSIVGENSLAGDVWNGTFPKGTAGAIITENILWGGKIFDGGDTLVRISGGFFNTGNIPLTRVFRIRPDYYKTDLSGDAASYFQIPKSQVTESMVKEIYNQYEKDWDEWPANKGAPFYDVNNDGKYEPDIDVPGVPGASQTLWINYNDGNSDSLFASPPIGLDIQETYWAYNHTGALSNIIYRKIDLVYNGTSFSTTKSKIDSMYITLFAYCSLGDFRNDLAGSDTTLNLGYVYNSSDIDTAYNRYFPAPPAVGYTFLQGVSHKTNNYSDSAIVNFKWRHGYKYTNHKPLNRFIYEAVGGSWNYPDIGNYSGTLKLYNIMRGYLPLREYPSSYLFPSSVTDYTPNGVYLLDGDPVTGTGKIDGVYDGPGIRGMFLTNGPFTLNLGDTAEVVIALVGGISQSHLASISNLRYNTAFSNKFYNDFVNKITSGNLIVEPSDRPGKNINPDYYVLFQNYPNPFNLTTTINYSIPKTSFVTIKVYDVLGREVSTLVNEEKQPGNYKIKFDGINFSSGIYFYQMNAGDYVDVKKFVLIK